MAKRHGRATAQAGQENRRGADTIGQAAQAAAALGEKAARASGNAARMAAGASEHAARAGAGLLESTAGAVEQMWRSGLDLNLHHTTRAPQNTTVICTAQRARLRTSIEQPASKDGDVSRVAAFNVRRRGRDVRYELPSQPSVS
jgi:hypothetical protein